MHLQLLKIILFVLSSAFAKKDSCKNPLVKLQKLFEISHKIEVIENGMCGIDESPSFLDYLRVRSNKAVYESTYAEWSDSPDPTFKTQFKRRDLNEINN